jgi:nitrate/TMAO reductase-like tetraheme cytochrome c subunit
MRKLWRWLSRPSPTTSVFTLLVVGIVVGIGGWLAFDGSLHATGTNEFCGTACHSHAQFIYPEYKKSVHGTNAKGVAAGCSDCHIPREFFAKLATKAKAGTHDAYAEFVTGSISTKEKFDAEAPRLAAHVLEEMKARDSKECRNCHDFTPEVIKKQSEDAQEFHAEMKKSGDTCVDCHTGVAHPEPAKPKKAAAKKS